MSDAINHPKHYTSHPSGVECITVTEHMNFNTGNAVKYIWRATEKHASPLEDLKKAQWYITREIQRLEGGKKPTPASEPTTCPDCGVRIFKRGLCVNCRALKHAEPRLPEEDLG